MSSYNNKKKQKTKTITATITPKHNLLVCFLLFIECQLSAPPPLPPRKNPDTELRIFNTLEIFSSVYRTQAKPWFCKQTHRIDRLALHVTRFPLMARSTIQSVFPSLARPAIAVADRCCKSLVTSQSSSPLLAAAHDEFSTRSQRDSPVWRSSTITRGRHAIVCSRRKKISTLLTLFRPWWHHMALMANIQTHKQLKNVVCVYVCV